MKVVDPNSLRAKSHRKENHGHLIVVIGDPRAPCLLEEK